MAEESISSIEDLDPASPGATESIAPSGDAAAANYGLDGRGDLEGGPELEAPPGAVATLEVAIAKAAAFLNACMTSNPRVTYKLGGKCRPGAVPGTDFTGIDCSGFVREALRRSTNLGGAFPDGSVVQHDWVKARGFPHVANPDGAAADGVVRIAFLSPGDTTSGIGHVVLLHQGKTLESHGGVGPDTRPWTGQGWQGKARVYVLDPTPGA